MPTNLRGRSILSLEELSPAEIRYLIRLAADLKVAKRTGTEQPQLVRRNIALIFEKDLTRTRSSFEVAAYDQGAHVTYIGPSGSHIGHKESMKDTARVLGRIYDAIEYRGFGQEMAETLAAHSGVPVYNGLTDEAHPTQALADFMTMREYTDKHLSDLVLAFVGDGKDNVATSLILGAAKVGMDMRIATPRSLWPDEDILSRAIEIGRVTGGRLTVTEHMDEAVKGADFLYTDVWVSMGEDELGLGGTHTLAPTLPGFGRCDGGNWKPVHKVHALPSRLSQQGNGGRSRDRNEIWNRLYGGHGGGIRIPASIVFDQAENRMHMIKAILVATLGN